MPLFADDLTSGEQAGIVAVLTVFASVVVPAVWKVTGDLLDRRARGRADTIAEWVTYAGEVKAAAVVAAAELKAQLAGLREEIKKLEVENDECQRRSAVQETKVAYLEEVVSALKQQNATQAGQIADLTRAVSAVKRDPRYSSDHEDKS